MPPPHGIRVQLDALVERARRPVDLVLPLDDHRARHPRVRRRRPWIAASGSSCPITRADGLLDWSVATPDGDITEGLFGLPEPVGEVLGPIAVNDVDLLIIPAAAVDRGGMRLGWGRGYFDKTIGSMERCPPVYAVVFDSEVVDEVPSDIHDQPVTGVVTPTQTITLAPVRR